MALGVTLRNRIVGIIIVVATFLIALPLLLSEGSIKRPTHDAIAVTEQGAVVDAQGKAVHQSEPDVQRALNLPQRKETAAPVTEVLTAKRLKTVTAGKGSSAEPEILTAPHLAAPENNRGSNVRPVHTEILTADKDTSSRPVHTEILTADNVKPQAPVRPAQTEILTAPPRPAASAANAANASGEQVIVGRRPTQRYVIQVASLSQRANADNVIKKLQNAGYAVYAVRVKSNGRDLYRVYAEQANNRDQLTASLARINKLCATNGRIITFN